MADEKFLDNEGLAVLWDKFKEYINANAVTTEGELKIELDRDLFGEPPYTLEFTEEDEEEDV